MLIRLIKKVSNVGGPVVKLISNFADDLGESLIEAKNVFFNDKEKKKKIKSLKIAILGLPNVGKSTLINHLVGKPVCAASLKVHTTRQKASAAYWNKDTQLIFLDTPGLVEKKDFKKFNLEDNFIEDSINATNSADIIAVVQDASCIVSRDSIDKKIIEILKEHNQSTLSVLVINKIDKLKNKKLLLGLIKDFSTQAIWPQFADIFMVSALTGDGVCDLREYFLNSAKTKSWEYLKNKFTDQPTNTIIQQIIKARFLNDLPQEIPYSLDVNVEHFEYCQDNNILIVANSKCISSRIARMIIGKAGSRIRKIARSSEQDLCAIFQTNVRLKIVVSIREQYVLNKKQ